MNITQPLSWQRVILVAALIMVSLPSVAPAPWTSDALSDFYISTYGQGWTHNDNWLVGDPCVSDWFGVECEDGRVVKISLVNNNLDGVMPDFSHESSPAIQWDLSLNPLLMFAEATDEENPSPQGLQKFVDNYLLYSPWQFFVGLAVAMAFLIAAFVSYSIWSLDVILGRKRQKMRFPSSAVFTLLYLQFVALQPMFTNAGEFFNQWGNTLSFAVPYSPFGLSLPWISDTVPFVLFTELLFDDFLLLAALFGFAFTILVFILQLIGQLVTALNLGMNRYLRHLLIPEKEAGTLVSPDMGVNSVIESQGSMDLAESLSQELDTSNLEMDDFAIPESYYSGRAIFGVAGKVIAFELISALVLTAVILFFPCVALSSLQLHSTFYDNTTGSQNTPGNAIAAVCLLSTIGVLPFIGLFFSFLQQGKYRYNLTLYRSIGPFPDGRRRFLNPVALLMLCQLAFAATLIVSSNWITIIAECVALCTMAFIVYTSGHWVGSVKFCGTVVFTSLFVRAVLLVIVVEVEKWFEFAKDENVQGYVFVTFDAVMLAALLCILIIPPFRQLKRRESIVTEKIRLYGADVMDPKETQSLLQGPTTDVIKAMTLSTGLKLISWEDIILEEKIGRGAAGVVWSGSWNNCKVAVKLLFDAENIGEELADDLVEVKMLVSLKHPNIIQFHGLSVNEGEVSLVLELMELGSLSSLVWKLKEKLEWKTRVHLLLDAAIALAYLHQNNIIHRDVKPHNLLVSTDWVCKVADFGISTLKTQTKTMTAVGTPTYMAPEVLNHARYGMAADVYSFGVVAIEVLTLRKAYSELGELNQVQLMYKIFHENLRPSAEGLPPQVADFLQTLLRLQPEDRPTMTEVVAWLKAI